MGKQIPRLNCHEVVFSFILVAKIKRFTTMVLNIGTILFIGIA